MGFSVTITRFMDFVQLVVSGPASIKNFVDMIQALEAQSQEWSDKCVLVDLRTVVGKLDEAEQIFLGQIVAQRLPHLEKLASVVPIEQLTRNSESAAQGLGMQLRVFSEKQEAVVWLQSKPAVGAPRSTPPAPGEAVSSQY